MTSISFVFILNLIKFLCSIRNSCFLSVVLLLHQLQTTQTLKFKGIVLVRLNYEHSLTHSDSGFTVASAVETHFVRYSLDSPWVK